jgi:CBS domain-containing protein
MLKHAVMADAPNGSTQWRSTMRSCNDLMTMDPTCCLASDPVSRAAQIMKDDDVGSVPVVDDASTKKLVGILTDRDIVIQVVAGGKNCADVKVEAIMTKNPVTCKPEEDVQNAMDRMEQHQVRRIPVVDGRDRIVGIIAQADLATRMDRPEQTEKVLEGISQPVS